MRLGCLTGYTSRLIRRWGPEGIHDLRRLDCILQALLESVSEVGSVSGVVCEVVAEGRELGADLAERQRGLLDLLAELLCFELVVDRDATLYVRLYLLYRPPSWLW